MKLKNLNLSLANVNTSPDRQDMEVVETSVNRVRIENDTLGRDIQDFSLHCLVRRGDILKVRVSKELASKVTKLTDALNQNSRVFVTFSGLAIKAYAMRGTGEYAINSGVSARADDFEYVVQDGDDDIVL